MRNSKKFSETFLMSAIFIIGSTLFIIYLMEVVASYGVLGSSQVIEIAKRWHSPFDVRSALEVAEDLRSRDVDIYALVKPSYFLASGHAEGIFPLGGLSRVATVYCNESGRFSTYLSDEHGFTNPLGLWDKDSLTIAVVGDSFSQGACVADDKNISAIIREVYPRTLNLGMGGHGPLLMLATLKEYLKPLQPKVVLWFFFEGNDLGDLIEEKEDAMLVKYLDSDFHQDLLFRQPEIDVFIMRVYEKEMKKIKKSRMRFFEPGSRFLARLKLQSLRRILRFYQERFRTNNFEKESLILFRRILKDARGTVDSWGGKFYFVYLPEWSRYSYPAIANQHRDVVLREVKNLGIPFIDIHATFAQHPDPLSLFPFRANAHYNEEGYRLVAEKILNILQKTETEISWNQVMAP